MLPTMHLIFHPTGARKAMGAFAASDNAEQFKVAIKVAFPEVGPFVDAFWETEQHESTDNWSITFRTALAQETLKKSWTGPVRAYDTNRQIEVW